MTVAESRLPDLVEIAEMDAEREALEAAIAKAVAALRAAMEERDRAEASYRRAYTGCQRARLKTFSNAVHALMLAERELAELER